MPGADGWVGRSERLQCTLERVTPHTSRGFAGDERKPFGVQPHLLIQAGC
jgi:hypothetical protein